MNAEESLAKSLEEIGTMLSILAGAIMEIDASLKAKTRGAGIRRYDVGGIQAAASNLGNGFRSRLNE